MTSDLFGAFAATLTTLSWMPQVRRTLRRGTASDFAWSYLALYGIGLGFWIVYGLIRADAVLLVANVVALASVVVLVVVKLRSRLIEVEHLELVLPAGTDPAAALKSLEQLGPRLAQDLRAVGIPDPDALRETGADEANRRLVEAGLQTGIHSRRAIRTALDGEGAVEDNPGALGGQDAGARASEPEEERPGGPTDEPG